MHGNPDIISDRAVGFVSVALLTPILRFFAGIRKAYEPVGVQALGPELAVEGEERSAKSPRDRLPRCKVNPLSVSFPGRDKSSVTSLA